MNLDNLYPKFTTVKLSLMIIIVSLLSGCGTSPDSLDIKPNETPTFEATIVPATATLKATATATATIIPAATAIDILNIPTDQLVQQVISGQIEYPADLAQQSQEKYEEFSILLAHELDALTPDNEIVTKRIGNTDYKIYWNADRGEWDAVTVDQEVPVQEESFPPLVVPFYQNEEGEWCTTDVDTGAEIVLADESLGGISFIDWAKMSSSEFDENLEKLLKDAVLQLLPDVTDIDLQEYAHQQVSKQIKYPAIINPNYSRNEPTQIGSWFNPVQGSTIEFPEERAKVVKHETNALIIPITLNVSGEKIVVGGINIQQSFRLSYIAIEFYQNGSVFDWDTRSRLDENSFGNQGDSGEFSLVLANNYDLTNDAASGDLYNESSQISYLSIIDKINQAQSISEIIEIIKDINYIYGEAYSLIYIKE